MAVPSPLSGRQFRVYVSDGVTSGDGRFKLFCTATGKTFNRQTNFEEAYLPDCADPDVVAQRVSAPTGRLWEVDFDGLSDPTNATHAKVETAYEAGAKVEIKISEMVVGGHTYTGFAWIENLTSKATGSGLVNVTGKFRGEGAYTSVAIT